MTTVLTLLTPNEQGQHPDAIQQWLVDNNIDTSNLAPGWISIERDDNGDNASDGDGHDGRTEDDKSRKGDTFIRYHAFKRDTAGNRIPDPDGRNQAWVEERTAPLSAELPDLGGDNENP